jgi:hypothetical protein
MGFETRNKQQRPDYRRENRAGYQANQPARKVRASNRHNRVASRDPEARYQPDWRRSNRSSPSQMSASLSQSFPLMGSPPKARPPKLALIYLTSLIRSGGRRNLVIAGAKLTQCRPSKIDHPGVNYSQSGGPQWWGTKQWKSGFVSDDRMETMLGCPQRRYFFCAAPLRGFVQ